MADGPWYRDGLNFTCTQCGNCCTGEPGYVWVTNEDIVKLAKHYGMDAKAFSRENVRRVGARFSLRERPNGDCVLLRWEDEKGICTAYDHRPIQCKTFPFWSENLRSKRQWDNLAAECPGINEGEHHSFVAIETLRRKKP